MTQWRPGEGAVWDGTNPPPLPDLPCFPALRGYPGLRVELELLGFRHVADLLRPPAPAGTKPFGNRPVGGPDDGFRVLDGVWFRDRGTRWLRVDEERVRRAHAGWLSGGDGRAAGAADLVDRLLAFVRHDPDGLRRVLLWQLACLLRDGSAGPTEGAAVALGVHPDEAPWLAAAVALGFPAAGPGREAAERLAEEWPDRRLCRAERTAAEVPDTGRDHVLTAVHDGLRAHRAEVDRLVGEALRLGGRGAHRSAGRAWFAALRRAADDPALETGLLGAAADAPAADSGPRLTAEVEGRTVRVEWPPARSGGSPLSFRLVRFPHGLPDLGAELAAGELPGQRHTDADPPVGRALRYALVPLREGRMAGVPLVSPPVVVAPAVRAAVAAPVPEGLRLRWTADPACPEVAVVRRAGRYGDPVPVPCGPDGLLDVPLPPGSYTYEITCLYPGPGGRTARSEPVRVEAEAARWPDQVTDLSARLLDGGERVALTWRPPDRGLGTVVSWPTGPVRPGTDVSNRSDLRLPQGTGAAEPSVELLLPKRSRLRLTAVSELAGRALTGPDVVVERPCTVRDLTVHRLSRSRASVRFGWPEPSVLVLLAWVDEDGVGGERRVARSRFLADGHAEFPVTSGSHRIAVTALPRPDALAVPADAARAELRAAAASSRLLPIWSPPQNRWDRWLRWWPFQRGAHQ